MKMQSSLLYLHSLVDDMKIKIQSGNFNFHILEWPFYDHIIMKMEKLFDIYFSKLYHAAM